MWSLCEVRSCSEPENLIKPADVRKRRQNHGLRLTLYVYVMADPPTPNPSLPWPQDCGQNRPLLLISEMGIIIPVWFADLIGLLTSK